MIATQYVCNKMQWNRDFRANDCNGMSALRKEQSQTVTRVQTARWSFAETDFARKSRAARSRRVRNRFVFSWHQSFDKKRETRSRSLPRDSRECHADYNWSSFIRADRAANVRWKKFVRMLLEQQRSSMHTNISNRYCWRSFDLAAANAIMRNHRSSILSSLFDRFL